MAFIYPYLNKSPQLHPSVFVAPGACIFGDVRAAEGVSFWCQSMARGDVNTITIGRRSNIQDLCALHVTEDWALTIGEEVTVGHHVMLHGCTIGSRCLIGMGTVILDQTVIGDECLIAAGSLITPTTVIPAGSLVMGSPGKVKRPLTAEERAQLTFGSKCYVEYGQNYLKTPGFPKFWPPGNF